MCNLISWTGSSSELLIENNEWLVRTLSLPKVDTSAPDHFGADEELFDGVEAYVKSDNFCPEG